MGTRLERMPLCSAVMQIDRHTAYINIKDPEVLDGSGLCIFRVQPSCRKSSTDPVPGPPHPLCRQRAEEIRIRDTDEAPFRCSRPRWREAGVAEAHRHVTIIIHNEKNRRISPNSPPNALYWWFKGPDPLVSHPLCSFTPRLHQAKRLPLRYQCLSTPQPPSLLPTLPPSIRSSDSSFNARAPKQTFPDLHTDLYRLESRVFWMSILTLYSQKERKSLILV